MCNVNETIWKTTCSVKENPKHRIAMIEQQPDAKGDLQHCAQAADKEAGVNESALGQAVEPEAKTL